MIFPKMWQFPLSFSPRVYTGLMKIRQSILGYLKQCLVENTTIHLSNGLKHDKHYAQMFTEKIIKEAPKDETLWILYVIITFLGNAKVGCHAPNYGIAQNGKGKLTMSLVLQSQPSEEQWALESSLLVPAMLLNTYKWNVMVILT